MHRPPLLAQIRRRDAAMAVLPLVLAPFVPANSSTDGAGQKDVAVQTVRDLVQLHRAKARDAGAVRVVYRLTGYDPEYAPGNAYLRCDFTLQWPDRFRFISAHGSDRSSWQEDPFQQEFYIDSEGLLTFEPFSRFERRRSYAAKACLPGSHKHNMYLAATGLWMLEERCGHFAPIMPHPPICWDPIEEDSTAVLRTVERDGERCVQVY